MSFATRDLEAEGWERSDFPVVCESCLGNNPYVRMMKADYDKECKVCSRPFTVFRWRPGAARDARYKKTEVCQTCAKAKNVCQVCLLDLRYGLPVQVIDQGMGAAAATHAVIPKSDVNREFFAERADRQAALGLDDVPYGKMAPSDTILKLQRTTPYYKRNRAHICSFFVKGTCTRGDECPYRHELPETGELSQQNLKDRYYGINDPVANKMLRKVGELSVLEPPEDTAITTLFIGGVDPSIKEEDIRDKFYMYGEVSSVRIVPRSSCAFVTFATREAAEQAASKEVHKLVIKGHRLKVLWGRPQQNQHHQDHAPRPVQPAPVQEQASTSGQAAPHHPGYNYFNLPAPSAPHQAYYPSMAPDLMGSRPPIDPTAPPGTYQPPPPGQLYHFPVPQYHQQPPPPGFGPPPPARPYAPQPNR
eukprot:jgi/Chlat1/6057/Chrsp4S06341